MNRHKVVLISSGQPSLNPRMLKEADALADQGYEVTVLYSFWNDWGTAYDETILPAKKWKAVCVGGDPTRNPMIYFLSKVIYKIVQVVNRYTEGKIYKELAIARPAYFLARAAKNYRADLYIGHNLGALPATVRAAKFNKKPCGFDAEDFHRNELSDNPLDHDVILKTGLEEHYFPQIDYLSVSSPLIASAYQRIFPGIKPNVFLNVFSVNPGITLSSTNPQPLKLFWFSQTIGMGRGLEDVLDACKTLIDYPLELHLLGQINAEMKEHLTERFTGVYFYEPISPDDIITFASQFDIGMAVEKSTPFNRDICLTNKIFTYLQAGLTVIASNTAAQTALMNQYPAIGKLYQQSDVESLAAVLLYYQQNRDILFETQKAAQRIAHQHLNWENESKKFLKLVEQTLNDNS